MSRKRGRYVSQKSYQFATGMAAGTAGTTGTTDTYDEREAAINADIQEEGTTDTHDEKETAVNTDTQEEWMEEDLREFEEVKERFLRWHKDAGSNLRNIYTGASRMTIW